MKENQQALLTAMQKPDFYPHQVKDITRIDTHISVIFLTGNYAYKIKKPVDLGFLDFTSLANRKFYCDEELRINRRTAPDIYLDVIPVYSSQNGYTMNQQEGQAIEYAVKMKQFNPEQQLDVLLKNNALSQQHLDELAQHIVDLHNQADQAKDDTDFATPDRLLAPCLENFEQLDKSPSDSQSVKTLRTWTLATWKDLKPEFIKRKQQGFIRECHGDMHLANIALINHAVTLFDGIEFDEYLRWIDVSSDLAFLLMDLESHERFDYAAHILNAYLSLTGDFDLMTTLRFYKVYRALVRAKVASLQQQDKACRHYIDLARNYTLTHKPTLFITVGLSGSGKSWGSARLSDRLGLLHIRSDIERKRIAGIKPTERTEAGVQEGLYSKDMGAKTYKRLAEISKTVLASSNSLIVDATFLHADLRQVFKDLAKDSNANFAVLYFKAEVAQLKENIKARQKRDNDPSDAGIAVLEHQLANFTEPLMSSEVIEINFGEKMPYQRLDELIND